MEGISMKAGRTIANIAAAVLIFFGVLFIWAAFGEESSPEYIAIGLATIMVGFGLIWFARRREQGEFKTEIIQKIELSGDVDLAKIKCDFCGGPLGSDDISMVAGAPVVKCPHCGSSYQITEAPKW
jgi:LPXTG-motif cell wall-anchored protein